MSTLTSPFGETAALRRALNRGQRAYRRGDLTEAERCGRWVLIRLGVQDDTAIANAAVRGLVVSGLQLVAGVSRERGDFTQAASLQQRALALLVDSPLGERDAARHLTALSELGETLRLLGRFQEAEGDYRRAVSLAEQLIPANPVLLAATLGGLGSVLRETGRFTRAAHRCHQALRLVQQALGEDDPSSRGCSASWRNWSTPKAATRTPKVTLGTHFGSGPNSMEWPRSERPAI